MRVLLAGRLRTLDDVANAAEYVASDLADFISGQHLLVSGACLIRAVVRAC
jgi:NAD(P)-dependent dehydrogenase (short-subunit alcohol dehydrogenase family)